MGLFADSTTEESESPLATGIPSYLVGADNHNLGTSSESLLNPSSWGEKAGNVGKFAVSALVRGVSSVYNIAPTVGNWFGGDYEKASTAEWLHNMDDDLGNYYDSHEGSVNVVGDVLASFVPGLAGVKVLNWAQKGVALATEGRAGWNMASHFGLLPSYAEKYALKAAAQVSSETAVFSQLNTNTLISLAAGYGQNALEFAAFEIAASTALKSSPLFEQHDLKDIFWNAAIGGGVIGGGIMGSLAAAKTFGTIRKSVISTEAALKPYTYIHELPSEAKASERILTWIEDLHSTPVVAETEENAATKLRLLQQREMRLYTNIRDSAHQMTGDTDLANIFTDTLKGLDKEQAFGNLLHLENISRVGTGELTTLEKLANKFQKNKMPEGELPPNLAKRFVKLTGEDAGQISDEAPKLLNLADKVKSSDALDKVVSGYKFSTKKSWSVLDAKDHFETEARYIWARKQTLTSDSIISPYDIPLLERAYELGLDSVKVGAADATLTLPRTEILNALEELKTTAATKLLEQSTLDVTKNTLTSPEIAKMVNVKTSYLEGTVNTVNREEDLLALQSAMKREAKRLGQQNPVEVFRYPTYARLVYDIKPMQDLDGHMLDAMAHIKAKQKLYQQSADADFANFAGKKFELFPERISDEELLKSNRYGAGSGFFTSANGNYGSLASKTEYIGAATKQLINDVTEKVKATFDAHGYKIKNDPEAAGELAAVRQLVLQTPEKYIWDAEKGALVNRSVAQYEEAVAAGREVKPLKLLDETAPKEIQIKSPALQEFIQDWITHNDQYLTHQMNLNARRGLQSTDLRGTFYLPPPNPKDFEHFAFVVDPTVTSTGHIKMIWAKDAQTLQDLATKVPPEFKVIFKRDNVEFHKALRDYDYSLGINENYIDTAFARKGVAAPFFPATDGSKLIDEALDWRRRTDTAQVRDFVSLKYSKEFSELRRLGEQYTSVATSKATGLTKYASDQVPNPYENYVKTALNLSTKDEYPIWTPLNKLVENAVSKVADRITDTFKQVKSPEELEKINEILREKGVKFAYEDAATELLANHTAPKPVLSNFIRGANSLLSTLMLRADPLNAVNNGIGHSVLLGSETRSLVRAIESANTDAAGELAQLAKVKLPGEDAAILSPAKLISNAYAQWAKKVIGNEDAGQMAAYFKEHGWLSTVSDQVKSIAEDLTLKGTETAPELSGRLKAAFDKTKALGDFAEVATGNKFAEEMNRFVAASVAKQLTDLGLKHGVLANEKEALAYINTFINRTQGNYLASQRPLMFQGPVGQAIGLFQTYQFNLLQQLFRYVSQGQSSNAALLMGLQGSIYGMNGLPAFNYINQHLVGNASGNTSHSDIISTTYDTAGKEAGDWLLYGLSSNMFLHPDLKVNLYTRGDINPRQVTVVPTTLAEVPIVGAFTRFLGAMKSTVSKMASGGDAYGSILQGIEHAGISRPLAGLAQTLEAFGNPQFKSYSTSEKGNIILANDLVSLTSLARLAGGRPLDEAIARDAIYRIQSYSAARQEEISKLGAAIKTKVVAGQIPEVDEINNFAEEYAKKGGKQGQFSQFMVRQILNANASQANQLSHKLSNPFSTYMQKIMGGYDLADMRNSSNE